MMTWEEVIISIRKDPNYADLVEKAYFDEDLDKNVKLFSESEEFAETIFLIRQFQSGSNLRLLDIGAGNGVASINFAYKGFDVTSVEPDPSNTVGSGAIKILRNKNKIDNINIITCHGEDIPITDGYFDIIYVRQALHHASNLNQLMEEAGRLLKKGGLFIAVREHVIFNRKEKQFFLENHPLHCFYGGENAYTVKEYCKAIENAGLVVLKKMSYFSSIINYYPKTSQEIQELSQIRREYIRLMSSKYPLIQKKSVLYSIFAKIYNWRMGPVYNEKSLPGRLYSFIAQK